jgi:hypothetical protein
MIIWAVIPSTDPARANEMSERWSARGYRTCLVINKELVPPSMKSSMRAHQVFLVGGYEGWFRTMNFCCGVLFTQGQADVVVCSSDRILPSETGTAHEIATAFALKFPGGVGVMQPTKHGCPKDDLQSPWIGKPFWYKTYGGRGPFYERYFQYFGNRELYAVAQRMGALWEHEGIAQPRIPQDAPDFYQKHNRAEYFDKDASTFKEREAENFIGADTDKLVSSPQKSLWLPDGV